MAESQKETADTFVRKVFFITTVGAVIFSGVVFLFIL